MPSEVVIRPALNGYTIICDENPSQVYVAKTTYDLAELIHRLFAKPKVPKLPGPPEIEPRAEMPVEAVVSDPEDSF